MKKGKKGLALAMTLAVTMTSVPTAFALDGNAQLTKQPDNQWDQRDTKAISYKYTKLDQAPMKESVKASSENTPMQWNEGPANLAFDGNNSTAWHTHYTYSGHEIPHWIQWDLGDTYDVGRISYTRKSDGATGTWKNVKIEATEDGKTWKTVCEKELAETAKGETTNIDFEPVKAKGLKITISDVYATGQKFASAGEINVYSATKEVTLVDPIKVLPEEGKNATMKEGETQKFRYELTPEAVEAGGTVEWKVQDSNVLKVDENGVVTAVGAGSGTVSANYRLGDTTYNNSLDVIVEKVETECAINLNGTDYTANSLEAAVTEAGVTELTSVKFENGVIREEDFDFLKKFNRIQYTLKEFSIGDDVKLRGLSGDAIPLNAFYASYPGYDIEKVYLGKNVKGMGMNAFGMCGDITSFEAPGLEWMNGSSLERVNGLTEFSLPSLKEVGAPLFGTMKNTVTTKVSLPSATTLANDAFSKLTALTELELGATPPQVRISSKGLEFATGVVDNLKLVIPEGALDAYKASPGYNAETNTWYGIKLSEPQEEVNINATINGTAVDGASLEKAVAASGVALEDIDSVTINSGKVTQEDLAYLKTIPRMETFEMNVGENLQLIGKDGNPTTVLSKDTAVIEFAGKPSGSSKATMRTLTLGGITEIYYEGLKGYASIETINMPDVITVGERAFCLGEWVDTLDLSSAKTIGSNAFNGCTRLETITMNAVETLGKDSFKYTDALDELTLPATIKTIEDIRFGLCDNGKKSSAKIKILASTPPTVNGKAFDGVGIDSTVTVPNGALAAYVAQVNPSADVAKVLKRQDIYWRKLYLREEGSSLIEYKAKCGTWADQYAYVTTGEKIPAEKMAALHKDDEKNLKENEEFKGWKIKETGEMLTAETVVSKDMTVSPVIEEKAEEINVTATVNGGEVLGAESLEKVIEKASETVDSVTSLTVESGKVTADDQTFIETLSNLETFELKKEAQLLDKEGNPTTVLDGEKIKLVFPGDVQTLTLGGITEIKKYGVKTKATTINLPDVVTVGNGAFDSFGSLETLSLSKATTIGSNAFYKCRKLHSLTLESVVELGESSFYQTDALEKLTLPATIQKIANIQFGVCYSGNKEGAKITILAANPPEVASGAFKGVTSGSELYQMATVTVPAGSLAAYAAQVGGADVTKVVTKSDILWNNLYLREQGSNVIEYYYPGTGNNVHNQYAYIPEGGTVGEEQIAEYNGKLEPGQEFKGWNTKEDGSGDMITAGYAITEETRVYPVIGEKAEEVNITATVNGGEAIGAENLAKVIEKAGVDRVENLTIDSGKVTPEDLETLKGLRYLETLEMNLDGDLTLVNETGESTTVLPAGLFEKSKLESVSLAGFTEIGEKAFKDTNNLLSVNIPNVTNIQSSAFLSTNLETIALPEVTTIGTSAFRGADELETVDMPKVETIGSEAFYGTAVAEFTLPATITSIGSKAFEDVSDDLNITILTATPPEAKGAFGKGQITVPDGALQNYLPSLDLSKPFWSTGDMKWNNLNVKDNAQRFITFKPNNGTADSSMYAYVVTGTAITEGRFPTTFENEGKILSGWNTAEDGSGTAVDANTVVTEDMTLYAQWSDPVADLKVTASCSNDDGHGGAKWTNEDVTVTLTANKAINDIEGWTRVSETELTKVHSENGTYQVTVTSADNQQAEVEYVVKHIDKQAPNVRVYGTGKEENYREITAVAVHDTKGVRYLTMNGVKKTINDKYKYLTDIKALGVVEGENTAVVVDKAGNQTEIKFHYDTEKPEFKWIVDNNTQAQSKEVRLETSEEIQLPDSEWKLQGEENGTFVYVKTFHANWKDKKFTVTDLAGNVSDPQFVEVKRIDNSIPTVTELTQDITEWTKKDVTVTIKTSTDCKTPEGWKKVNKRTFTKVFSENGDYSVTLTSVTGVPGEAYPFSITNIDKEAPVIDYKAIEAANGYKREIPVNEGEEYTEEQLVEMFTKPDWVTDNSGHAEFKVDKWGLEHGLDGYKPFTSKTPGTYKVRFYAYDAAGNSSTFDVYVKVLEAETPEERTTTVNYTVFLDNGVRTGTWTHTGTEEGTFEFEVSMTGLDLEGYVPAEGETGSRTLTYGETTSVTFYLVSE